MTPSATGGRGLYTLVSSQDRKQDLERQMARLQAWADTTGLPVIRAESEVASGTDGARPEIRRLLADPALEYGVADAAGPARISADWHRWGSTGRERPRDAACFGCATEVFHIGRTGSGACAPWLVASDHDYSSGFRRRNSCPPQERRPVTTTRGASGLRVIAPAFIAAAPSGVRIRTRLHPIPAEEAALFAVGTLLGSLYRKDLAARIRLGKVPAAARGRSDRKRNLTALSSSRWAGTITRTSEDQYQLGMRALAAEAGTLRAACAAIEKRAAVPCGTVLDGTKGYKSPAERHQKTRRLAALQARLADATEQLSAGKPTVVIGSGRLWRTRNNLDEAGLIPARWDTQWAASRLFLTADGESGKRWGNETIRISTDGHLSLKVPAALSAAFGSQLHLSVPVLFSHRAGEWHDRAASSMNIRYDISHNPDTGRWYVDASWGYRDLPVPPLDTLQGSSVLGIDLNADHLAGCVTDSSGNPVGAPLTIPLDLKDIPATTRDGRLRAAITALLDAARNAGCAAVAIENLNFHDARSTGRETMGRGGHGKTFRRTVAGIPTAKFRDRLVSMAANRGLHIIVVDPAYTSKWGDQHWRKPLQQTTEATVTRHHGAAVAIGRRAGGFRIRRREDGPRTRQRTSAGQPSPRPRAEPTGTAPLTGLSRPTVTNRSGPTGTRRGAAPKTVRGASTKPIRTD